LEGTVVATLPEIEARLLAIMPTESTVDRRAHAHAIACVVIAARNQAVGRTREKIGETRMRMAQTRYLIRDLRRRIDARQHVPTGR